MGLTTRHRGQPQPCAESAAAPQQPNLVHSSQAVQRQRTHLAAARTPVRVYASHCTICRRQQTLIEHPTLYIATRAERDAQRFTLAPPMPVSAMAPSAAELRWRPEVAGRGASGVSHLACCMHAARISASWCSGVRSRPDGSDAIRIGSASLGARSASAPDGLRCHGRPLASAQRTDNVHLL